MGKITKSHVKSTDQSSFFMEDTIELKFQNCPCPLVAGVSQVTVFPTKIWYIGGFDGSIPAVAPEGPVISAVWPDPNHNGRCQFLKCTNPAMRRDSFTG